MRSLAIHPLSHPIKASVEVPGCISYTIRALTISAMTPGSVKISNPTKSDDSYAMVTILRTLGIAVEETENAFIVHGTIDDVEDKGYVLDVNISGRTARSVLALLTIVPGIKTLTCKEAFKKRPVGDLVDGLRQLGARIEYLERECYLPVKISSSKLVQGSAKMAGKLSSQYFSALMMIAPRVGEIEIEVIGEQSSKPFIDVTVATMKAFGVTVVNNNYHHYHIPAGEHYKNPKEYIVEADAIAATYFWSIAAITQSTLRVLHISPNSAQGDVAFVDILKRMGCTVTKNEKEKWIEVIGKKNLLATTVDMNATPDSVMSLAVVAAFAKGKTIINNIEHLKIKETDRLTATFNELQKIGIKATMTNDSLTIPGSKPHGGLITTYGDHRMAMSFAVSGTRIDNIIIKNPDVVSKAFPKFWETLINLGVAIEIFEKNNIVLIGMRGSGKTTVAKVLSEKLQKRVIDLDEHFVKKNGMSISAFVEKYGWDTFRQKEKEIVDDVSLHNNCIIATGGGVVINEEHMLALKKHGICIYLKTPVEKLLQRMMINPGDRPALTNKQNLAEELQEIFNKRKSLYEGFADITVLTDRETPEEIAENIIEQLQ